MQIWLYKARNAMEPFPFHSYMKCAFSNTCACRQVVWHLTFNQDGTGSNPVTRTMSEWRKLVDAEEPFEMGFGRNFNRNIRLGLKILRLRACRFESYLTHYSATQTYSEPIPQILRAVFYLLHNKGSLMRNSSMVERVIDVVLFKAVTAILFFCIRSTYVGVRIPLPQFVACS